MSEVFGIGEPSKWARKNKVAVCGSAPESIAMIPQDDPEWDIWGLNSTHITQTFRFDAWFEIHGFGLIQHVHKGKHWDWLSKQDKPIFMQAKHPDIPTSVAYPKALILERFKRRYFTSGISWMLALAIEMGYETIGVFGVDMQQKEEYATKQKAGVDYMLGYIEALGRKLVIPATSDLLKTPSLYGFGSTNEFWMKCYAHKIELEGKRDEARQQRDYHANTRHAADGAKQILDKLLADEAIQGPPREKIAAMLPHVEKQIEMEMAEAEANALNERLFHGAIDNLEWVQRFLNEDDMTQAEMEAMLCKS